MKFLSALLVLMVSTASLAVAKTVDLSAEQFTLDLPDSWSVVQQPTISAYSEKAALALAAQDSGKPSGVEILVCNNVGSQLATSPGIVARLKDSLTSMYASHGGDVQFTAESQTSLDGVPAELLPYTVNMDPTHTIHARTYVLAANGRIYLISLRTLDPADDAGLETIANSLHFSSPPVLPTPPAPHIRRRYIFLAAAAVVVIVAMIVGFIIYRRRQDD